MGTLKNPVRASLLPWLYLLNYAQCTLIQVLVTFSDLY